ncbi:hypothetical protein [Noviherbaspirillum sp.]|uniref:hypothetical protein n=1 Tax=Noviherbaspirillum sp. TaxID=1926288 RepID=UPI002FE3B84F
MWKLLKSSGRSLRRQHIAPVLMAFDAASSNNVDSGNPAQTKLVAAKKGIAAWPRFLLSRIPLRDDYFSALAKYKAGKAIAVQNSTEALIRYSLYDMALA